MWSTQSPRNVAADVAVSLHLNVYLSGSIVFVKDLMEGKNTIPVIVEGMRSGVYYYRAFMANRGLVKDRVVVIK